MMTFKIVNYVLLSLCTCSMAFSFSVNSIAKRSTTSGRIVSPLSSAAAPELITTEIVSASSVQEEERKKETKIIVGRPQIHWTVPGFKHGWRDEETGNWYDVDGIRNGPPMNYWRQSIDQREYLKDMNVIDAVLNNDMKSMNEQIIQLENRFGMRYPLTSRKLLGEWAPLVRNGTPTYLSTTKDNSYNKNTCAIPGFGYNDGIEVPFKLQIERTNGRMFGEKNKYGLFDRKLDVGEMVTITTTTNIEKTLSATKENVPIVLDGDVVGGELFIGGITYMTDYIMVQRRIGKRGSAIVEGDIDVWVRCDENYLGATKKEKEEWEIYLEKHPELQQEEEGA